MSVAGNPLEQRPMTGRQWVIVAIMVSLLALDGFDVLSISFASPGIAADWGIDRAALGFILSMELVGMAFGSILFGRIADRIGRRATILACLAVMAGGMFGASSATGPTVLSGWRVFTGLGLGGMLAATNAATAEIANARYRAFCVVLMAGGYPLGNIVGGSVSAWLLTEFSWHAIFIFGGAIALLFIPIVWFMVPESISFLASRGGAETLGRVNRVLHRLGQPAVDNIAAAPQAKASMGALLSSEYWRRTILLTVAYFAHFMTFYFILKWIPKIVADMGFEPSMAAGVLVSASVGGALGCGVIGLLSLRLRVGWLTIGTMLLSAVAVFIFGRSNSHLQTLSMIAAAAGFFTNAGVVGLYAIVAQSFPTRLRATATGFVIGFGRGGSALAPFLAGVLFAAGFALGTVALLMALGSLLAAAALLFSGRLSGGAEV
ncbi:MFS transporter [Parerythrobacter aestuarii]|uniref:MFS transporter n=1 Tax=Parerythrobacter aestuarii TaxID=3020909 RepID=UPI0024DEA30B|nr:MFS transporter [Parerythrobacter aestuarii]